jgi:hypothetical protein
MHIFDSCRQAKRPSHFVELFVSISMATKIYLIYFILLVNMTLLFSCESTRRTTTQKEQFKAIYLDQFKLTYFRQLLAKSYNNSVAVREIIGTDHSGFTEPILTEDDHYLIDSLTTIDNEYLKIDSTEGNRRAEGAQGKRPLGFVMQKLTGKWLDSLAKRRLKLSGVPDSWTD